MAKKVMKKSAPKVKKDANQKQTKPVKEPKPFKKPASLPFDPPKEEGMSLEAKRAMMWAPFSRAYPTTRQKTLKLMPCGTNSARGLAA